jgi:hypothetical protein
LKKKRALLACRALGCSIYLPSAPVDRQAFELLQKQKVSCASMRVGGEDQRVRTDFLEEEEREEERSKKQQPAKKKGAVRQRNPPRCVHNRRKATCVPCTKGGVPGCGGSLCKDRRKNAICVSCTEAGVEGYGGSLCAHKRSKATHSNTLLVPVMSLTLSCRLCVFIEKRKKRERNPTIAGENQETRERKVST